ncbi:MAG: hypothetical protein FWD61_10770 [Phycisphaerales bacterium]|nr:hypothetical protein [Phycisphaerales bacterium]
MKFAILVALIVCCPLAALAQTVYEPPRYQFGRYGEIFYGGTNPDFFANNYSFFRDRPLTDIRIRIFSDRFPYEEAGRFGYTINDVRNEAYANVPRLQTMPPSPPPAPAATPSPVADQRLKAIPLLHWAKAEQTRNPALYKALIYEAAKYDPAATTALVKQLQQAKPVTSPGSGGVGRQS